VGRSLNFFSFADAGFYAILSRRMLVYAVTIFLSAFLLFQVQPLIAKFSLPWFGGSAAVWSAGLVFFQLMPGDESSVITSLAPKPGFIAWTGDFSNIITIIK
jgi:hypothetical protein